MSNISQSENKVRSVDAVVPIYKDVDVTRRCIESVLNNRSESLANLIIIDDASPDDDVVHYCDELAQQGKVTLLRNEKNLGFVASVNLGMNLNSDNDVVLLNSDTEVSGNWLERLKVAAYAEDKIATVTPFSNNATICSYPLFLQSNELPAGWSLAAVDDLFAKTNKGQYCQIPTAVGFCMYIRRDSIDNIGLFDEKSFGRGYGEENDFSMRAKEIGWKNILCADVFVYHQGGVSFGSEAAAQMSNAEEVMAQKHPSYGKEITNFIVNDSLRQYRDRIDIARAETSESDMFLVLEEGKQYQDILMKNISQYQDLLDDAWTVEQQQNKVYKKLLDEARSEYQQQQDNYETLLEDVRSSFTITDKALADLQIIYGKTLSKYDEILSEYNEISSELTAIKNSHFWRYTQWLRNILGKS